MYFCPKLASRFLERDDNADFVRMIESSMDEERFLFGDDDEELNILNMLLEEEYLSFLLKVKGSCLNATYLFKHDKACSK